VPALDQVESTLRGRYLIRFPTPGSLPARVSVQVGTDDLTLTGDAVVPPAPAAPGGPVSRTLLWSLAGTVVVASVLALTLLLVLRARRPREPLGPPALAVGFRGRAPVPGSTARGRAQVPDDNPSGAT
jgi:glyoxylase-like metal-dependent hydrolase (beta-lactamase superfamily II)